MRRLTLALILTASPVSFAQAFPHSTLVHFDHTSGDIALADHGHTTAIYLDPSEADTLAAPVEAFASDIERVTGSKPQILTTLPSSADNLILIGSTGHPLIDDLSSKHKLDTISIHNKWESALTTTLDKPLPGIKHALLIAGSDRRGAAFALFTLSRQMGVSPWNWWADVPVPHHDAIFISAHNEMQPEPSVPYRGIFLNDEDWGLRPWAAKTMDPSLHNVGPNTYARVFELLLRLHANSLWPAMHPGTLTFNAVPENAKLADKWGIIMGSSHSEALLRNNVGEWNEKTDGPWNYQLNKPAIDAYWDKRLAENGHFENFYTVGMRGVHDTGLEATGDAITKARLVEQVMHDQRDLLAKRVNPDVTKIPQVIWLYKESLELYRAGMKVPYDVTLGWTDDNYGYIRQLPTVAEQQRPGGSGIYYHVSYWGFPHDHLWLSSTPPALIREEMTKAFDHNARRYWVLNVGDIKPAETDIDYFMQLAWNEPAMAKIDQRTFLTAWAAEQFPATLAPSIANLLDRYYQLNFVRKPEFMGFNGYDDGINRTAFNPLAWGDQNATRDTAWQRLAHDTTTLASSLPAAYRDAWFELVGYPIEAAAAQNEKFLAADRTYLDAHEHKPLTTDAATSQSAYDRIQTLTAQYNSLQYGKWDGMISSAPRKRHVFEMPTLATAADAAKPLPASWGAPASPQAERAVISLNAAHFSAKFDGTADHWNTLADLGITGTSIAYGSPGLLANRPPLAEPAPWLEYTFTTTSTKPAQLSIYTLPTFPVDADHHLSFDVSLDGGAPQTLDPGATGEWHENTAPTWAANVLRNAAVLTLPLGELPAGSHKLRLIYRDPGVVFQHLTITYPDTPPAYPVPPPSR
jgi:hypothetical protein